MPFPTRQPPGPPNPNDGPARWRTSAAASRSTSTAMNSPLARPVSRSGMPDRPRLGAHGAGVPRLSAWYVPAALVNGVPSPQPAVEETVCFGEDGPVPHGPEHDLLRN